MNELIENIFKNFTVESVEIPVEFINYSGHETTYITYNNVSTGDTFYTDNNLTNYIEYYDFDIYSKGNYFNVMESVIDLLEQNGFDWQPTMSSSDMYEEDTGYYHKTICFAYVRSKEELNNG